MAKVVRQGSTPAEALRIVQSTLDVLKSQCNTEKIPPTGLPTLVFHPYCSLLTCVLARENVQHSDNHRDDSPVGWMLAGQCVGRVTPMERLWFFVPLHVHWR